MMRVQVQAWLAIFAFLSSMMVGGVQGFQPLQFSKTSRQTAAPTVGRAPRMPSSTLAESGATSTTQVSMGKASSSDAPPLRRNPPRKVCLMVEPTPFTHVSGYANRFKEMLKFMKKAGDDVDILTVDAKTPAAELPDEYLGYPVRHTQGFTFPLYRQISLTIDLPEMKGARILERLRPDLIHVTSPGFLVYTAIFYARVMCVPLVMSYHTHLPVYADNYLGFIPGASKISWSLLRWVHSRADLTLVTSPQMRDELLENGIPRVDVWRKGIDTERFDPKFRSQEMRAKMTDGHPDDFLMVYVGRLGAEKRLKDIKAMLAKMPSNTRLCIVGKGPQQGELEEWFKGTNTVFTGQLSGDELSQAFASADTFIMPSDSETLGFVVLESMASGVPVVGAAAGGIPDLIDSEKTGFLVTPGDTDTYVQRLEQLRDESFRKKMGQAARKEAERWGWEAATSQLRNVQYEKALLNHHSRAFGGFGRPGTAGVWRLLGWRISRVLQKVGFTLKTRSGFGAIWKRFFKARPKLAE
uniref:Glycosyltransferase subfamily 4-like N-terminal domain-containing protein n=1 Tax=Entomoneis paludosa TaxID=265537 RepID=A0A7S2YAZ2_9STRA|mmetsp:Transcript_25565/g.53230  ORF Transcript_25565/g.53230 Transcript_25565/m.53230 type:complete len:525 (+) Transcript_25565:264-1838(+)|eukprot:CAMPEP_0172447524 /NCGR_PEP_ID=MMETSP1065-20121228/6820_1 /TAXON_ID=265537 /ORGANISM="Amphiprora paludosa, Strain CCMP125" /LENGTH=524 /DNA_ID=CAMNT_0013198847 /DNA_START=248 /DNA_END=1822 /DNA_ORIENTATION=-